MSNVLPSGLTVPFAWLAMRPSDDLDFLLDHVNDVVTDEDKQVLMNLLQPYAFSPKRSDEGLDRSVSAIKKLRNMETVSTKSDGL